MVDKNDGAGAKTNRGGLNLGVHLEREVRRRQNQFK